MPCLLPPTLIADEQNLILRVTTRSPRDYLIISMALGTFRVLAAFDIYIGETAATSSLP